MGMMGVGAFRADSRIFIPRSVMPFRAYRLRLRSRSTSSGCCSRCRRAASAVAQLAGGMDAEKMKGLEAWRTYSATSSEAAM